MTFPGKELKSFYIKLNTTNTNTGIIPGHDKFLLI